MIKVIGSIFLLISALVPALSVYAASDQQCTDLVKECFAYSNEERETCFQTVATHPFCTSSSLATLAKKRAEFSPLLPNNSDTGPAFLGPQLVDHACLVNFDSAWSSALVKDKISKETFTSLNSALDQCQHVPASEIMRP